MTRQSDTKAWQCLWGYWRVDQRHLCWRLVLAIFIWNIGHHSLGHHVDCSIVYITVATTLGFFSCFLSGRVKTLSQTHINKKKELKKEKKGCGKCWYHFGHAKPRLTNAQGSDAVITWVFFFNYSSQTYVLNTPLFTSEGMKVWHLYEIVRVLYLSLWQVLVKKIQKKLSVIQRVQIFLLCIIPQLRFAC